jgi:hypothetical protein
MSTSAKSGVLRWALTAAVLAWAAASAAAQGLWQQKPPEQWTIDDALEVLQNSDWAHEEDVLVRHWPEAWATQDLSPMERVDVGVFGAWASYLVRWESARPVVQAFDRLEELGATTSADYQGPPAQLPDGEYVVTVKATRLPPSGLDPLEEADEGDLLLLARLKTRQTTMKPDRVQRTGMGANAAVHFYFPRASNGNPLLGSGTEEVEFGLKLEGFDLKSKFILKPGGRL